MKRCPQCGAEYDDYVQYCFVDGAELADVPAGQPAPVAKRSTPVPPPPLHPPVRPAPLPPPAVHRPVQDTARGLSIWALVVLFMFVITLFGVGGVVGALFLIGGAGPTAQPVEAPAPRPAPPPPVVSTEPLVQSFKIRFESEPPGAAVWENDTLLCSPTPCDVNQPEGAPDQRKFVLRLEGFADTPYTMSDPSALQTVPLSRGGRSPKPPRPAKPPGDDILNSR